MPKLLNQNNHQGWPYIKCLVIGGLQFMEPLLRSGELTEPVCILTMMERQAIGRWLFNRRKRRTSINHNNKTNKVVDQVFIIKYLGCSLVSAPGRPNIRRHL
ncbi:hypothetical protein HanRHA438_Chr08g0329081 [Helianthus annuus]|nr:hypothetical protein HanRHA438_Chr08g0329081 [Helianthus annuus]